MGYNNFPYNFPTSSQQFVNPSAGTPTTNFWRYEQAIFNRTGGANGTSYQVAAGLTAAGANAATALALGADWNQVTTATAGQGVLLPTMQPGSDISVWNDTAVSLTIYPPSGFTINGMSSVTLTAGELSYFQCWTSTQILQIYAINIP